MTHSDLASIFAVEDCGDVGAFDVETDDGRYVSLLCKKHANELVSVTLPEGQRYVIEDAAVTGQYRIRDTRMGWLASGWQTIYALKNVVVKSPKSY